MQTLRNAGITVKREPEGMGWVIKVKQPKGWKCSMKQNDATMIMMEFRLTKLAYLKLLLKTAWSFDIGPLWIKPFVVAWVSLKLFLK